MEEQLNTRAIMTGGAFLAAFLGAYLLHHCPEQLLSDIGSDYASLIVGLLSAPFFGWAIGAIVLLPTNWRYGRTYHGPARDRVKQWAEERLRDGGGGSSEQLSKLGHNVCGDDIFAYIMNSEYPEGLIEWGRRQHTARSMGWSWFVATILGLFSGFVVGPHDDWGFRLPVYMFLAVVVVAMVAVFVNGLKARHAIENVECLWLEDFISRQTADTSEDHEHGETIPKVICQPKALLRWAEYLQPRPRDTFLSNMRSWLSQSWTALTKGGTRVTFSPDPINDGVYGKHGFKKAIENLFSSKCYGPGIIVIFAFIDALANVSRAEDAVDSTPEDFKKWIDRYLHIPGGEVLSADDWWEARNAIVHLFGSDSRKIRKVNANKVNADEGNLKRIVWQLRKHKPSVCYFPDVDASTVIVDVLAFRDAFFTGLDRFLKDLFGDPTKNPLIETRLRDWWAFIDWH